MSTHHINQNIEFECDTCGETYESYDSDFTTAWNAAKRNGWTARKVGEDWVHTCDDCNSEEDN